MALGLGVDTEACRIVVRQKWMHSSWLSAVFRLGVAASGNAKEEIHGIMPWLKITLM